MGSRQKFNVMTLMAAHEVNITYRFRHPAIKAKLYTTRFA